MWKNVSAGGSIVAAKSKPAKAKPAKTKSKKAKPLKAKAAKTTKNRPKAKPARAVKAKAKVVKAKAKKTAPSRPKIAWPKKTREMHNHHMNSTVWNGFKFRNDDIVVATYAKSGTTWTQQIVAQLVFDGAEGVDVARLSPWVDLRIIPPEVIAGLEGQTHRRIVKTHLPVDALVFSPKAKYIFVGRDGRDAAWSLFNHHASAVDDYFNAFNNTPGRVGPPLERGTDDVHEFYANWFASDGFPYWPVWENIRSWWKIRNLPNVKLIHFNDMKADLAGSIREIADFLGIKPDAASFPRIVEHCTFDYMKAHAELAAPLGGVMWHGGAQTFINKGTNGRWRDTLSATEVAAYEARAAAELGPACAKWLAQGKNG
jgi:aryl sulfotransferase